MKIQTVICPTCREQIYSRAHYDFRYCSCGEIAVDGGREYLKFSFKNEKPQILEIELDITEQELYNDWNKRINKYGKVNN